MPKPAEPKPDYTWFWQALTIVSVGALVVSAMWLYAVETIYFP